MKRGTILKNLWAGHETYFVYMGFPVRSGIVEAKKTGGYKLTNVGGKWIFERTCHYCHSLRDQEHFPVVGFVDLEKACIAATLKAIGRVSDENA